MTREWSSDDWDQWVGFSVPVVAFGVCFLACWLFGA